MAIALHDTTQRILLPDVRWYTYEALLADMDDTPAARLAYDHGTLEIMVPSFSHEQLNRLLAAVVEALAMSMHLDFIQRSDKKLMHGTDMGWYARRQTHPWQGGDDHAIPLASRHGLYVHRIGRRGSVVPNVRRRPDGV